METQQKFLDFMERMEKINRKQVFYARLQFLFTVIAAVCCIVLLVTASKMVPMLQETAKQAETVLSNLETVTTQLAQADLAGMVGNVDDLVTTSQEGVKQALDKINGIDFDALNEAIKDLSDVINPITNFFRTFRIG